MLGQTVVEETTKTFNNSADYLDTGIQLPLSAPNDSESYFVDVTAVVELAANADLATAGSIILKDKLRNLVLKTINFSSQHRYFPEYIVLQFTTMQYTGTVTRNDYLLSLFIKKESDAAPVDVRKQTLSYRIIGPVN